jgi:hypothetical protein
MKNWTARVHSRPDKLAIRMGYDFKALPHFVKVRIFENRSKSKNQMTKSMRSFDFLIRIANQKWHKNLTILYQKN